MSRRGGGRPKQRPEELVADRAYDSKRSRRWLRSKEITLGLGQMLPTLNFLSRRLPAHCDRAARAAAHADDEATSPPFPDYVPQPKRPHPSSASSLILLLPTR